MYLLFSFSIIFSIYIMRQSFDFKGNIKDRAAIEVNAGENLCQDMWFAVLKLKYFKSFHSQI